MYRLLEMSCVSVAGGIIALKLQPKQTAQTNLDPLTLIGAFALGGVIIGSYMYLSK